MVNSFALETPLRKHADSNILKISPQNTEYFSDKKSDIFHISEAVLTKSHNLSF